MRTVDRAFVEHLPEGAQLIEVLPKKEYAWGHLPGALSLPLKELHELAPKMLDRDRLVVTYCNDYFCDLSPRAASWLEHHGFTDVADFAGGKQTWLAYGLPYEGDASVVLGVLNEKAFAEYSDERAEDVAILGPSTVRPNEERAELDKRMMAKELGRIIVTNPEGVPCGIYEH